MITCTLVRKTNRITDLLYIHTYDISDVCREACYWRMTREQCAKTCET